MARTAVYDPVVVDSVVTADKVRELIERRAESAKLDYKSRFDPRQDVHRVKLVKHVLAMANTAGGYLLLGVENDGTVRGLSDEETGLLDEAAIRAQVAGYTTVPVSMFLANRMVYDDAAIAVITVLPSRDRLVVATSDGQFKGKSGQMEALFRSGDVLVRHGSASERWNQDDADWVLGRLRDAAKDSWLREFSGDIAKVIKYSGAEIGTPDVGRSAFERPPEDFEKLATDLLRRPNG